MTGIIDWAAERARMILAFVAMTIIVGITAYVSLPKEGEPDIEIPALFVSVPFPGISAADSETLLVKPMETELSDIDGIKTMSSTAAEGYAGVALEFEFGWDKAEVIADVRDKMNTVEGQFPEGADKYSINEINFSEFPIIIVNLSGAVPERTLVQLAKDLQDRIEGIDAVLEAGLAGQRDEMVEVLIDPLRLEAYNVTATELIAVVQNNNQLIAAGEIETPNGTFAVKIPSSFNEPQDIYDLPVKTNGDRVVTLGDLAEIRLTFEDRTGTARFNGEKTVAIQVVKRKGFNVIDTADAVREAVAAERETWPQSIQDAVNVGTSNDQSREVKSMVQQLQGSVLTAVALVFIVVLAALGTRSALLVGFAIPTSFLLAFIMLGLMGVSISNIVMFGLILAVGMLVDGAIVVVEYADRRISEGVGPMHAFTEAAKRMFWPIISSTATTLCAFMPMLFWPGVAGQFMGMLPVTLIFVLSASLVVALVYLPVVGGVFGRGSRTIEQASAKLKPLPWLVRAALVPVTLYIVFLAGMQLLNPEYLLGEGTSNTVGVVAGLVLFMIGALASSVTLGAAKMERREKPIKAGYRRSPFGWFIYSIAGNPIMPLVTVGVVVTFVMMTFGIYGKNNYGVEFFVESEPEQAIIYVRQRGNLSLDEKDEAVKKAEAAILGTKGVQSAFAFAGEGGLDSNTGGAEGPADTIGQIQLELIPWEDRGGDPELDGNAILERINDRISNIPGVRAEITELVGGPAAGKPVHLRLFGNDWAELEEAVTITRAKFEETEAVVDIEDTLPLPGIDWQIDVDVEKAGRYGANVAAVGGMVQLVTRGILLDTMRVDTSDEEIEIRVRLPEEDRVLSTLDSLRVRTAGGLVPLSNFISRQPVQKLGEINRVDQKRIYDVKAGVAADTVTLSNGDGETVAFVRTAETEEGGAWVQRIADDGLTVTPINANERIAVLTTWLETNPLPAGIDWEWTGDQQDQAETGAFLGKAFGAALAMMFVILLAQFNSFYNSALVLVAVVMSTAGVLIGMLLLKQPFSMIMTGTGVVALAGIVVNNNIVLIDTYQEYARYMPRIEAIVRSAQNRIRPVLLTTITTMAGLAPMMLGLSLDFLGGGYTVNSPAALWWIQLATAVVFGLGIATVLTLVFTPAMLALRVWLVVYLRFMGRLVARITTGSRSTAAMDWSLNSKARKIRHPELIWDEPEATQTVEVEPEVEETAQTPSAEVVDHNPDDDADEKPPKVSPIKAAE